MDALGRLSPGKGEQPWRWLVVPLSEGHRMGVECGDDGSVFENGDELQAVRKIRAVSSHARWIKGDVLASSGCTEVPPGKPIVGVL